MAYPAQAPAPPKPKGMFITGIVLVVLAIVIFVACLIWGTTKIVTAASDSPVIDAPGETTTTLEAGEHALWTPIDGEFLFADDVTITGPSGEVRGTDYFSSSSGSVTLTKGTQSFSPEVTFTAPTTGAYTVEVLESGPTTDVLVGPPPSTVTQAFAIIAVAFVLAGIIGLIGLILFIVGLVKRGKAKRPPSGPYGPPPGYAQPPTYGQPPAYGQPPGYAPQPGPPAPPGYGQPGPYTPPPAPQAAQQPPPAWPSS
jgi:hypothetical protein